MARLAEVSHQTVSRVLNDHQSIRPATRQRVLDAMAELNFTPSRVARMLATSRTYTVGVLATVSGTYYGPTSAISAIEDAARDAGYSTLLASPRNVDATGLSDAIEYLIREGVEGIVVLAPQTLTAKAMAQARHPVPVVMMQPDSQDADPGLSVDNEAGGALAAQHLWELGHRRLALVAGPADWAEAGARRRGFEKGLAAVGARPVAVAGGDWSAESGYAAFARIAGSGFTGVFCANDQMALGVMHAASDCGLRLPGDLSLVGFDDVPEAAHYRPPLTTLRQEFDIIGRRAIGALLARVQGDPVARDEPVRPQMIVRASTTPPRASAP